MTAQTPTVLENMDWNIESGWADDIIQEKNIVLLATNDLRLLH